MFHNESLVVLLRSVAISGYRVEAAESRFFAILAETALPKVVDFCLEEIASCRIINSTDIIDYLYYRSINYIPRLY